MIYDIFYPSQKAFYMILCEYYKNRVAYFQKRLLIEDSTESLNDLKNDAQKFLNELNQDEGESAFNLQKNFISQIMTQIEHAETKKLHQKHLADMNNKEALKKFIEYVGLNFNWYKNK